MLLTFKAIDSKVFLQWKYGREFEQPSTIAKRKLGKRNPFKKHLKRGYF